MIKLAKGARVGVAVEVAQEFAGVTKLALNLKETAFALSTSTRTVRRLKERGLLRPIDAIGKLTFSTVEINRFLTENTNALQD